LLYLKKIDGQSRTGSRNQDVTGHNWPNRSK
jgi:hypothetical protein